MNKAERGAGSGEFLLIAGIVVYFVFLGYLGNAAGYTTSVIGALGSWQIPYVDIGGHWYSVFTGTLDVLIAVINVFGWVLGALVSYFALMAFSVQNLPMWMSSFLIMPVVFGMG